MAILTIDNLPDDLLEQIQKLANQNHQPINEQVINLLKQALQKPQPPLKFLISPETDPTWEERRKATPQLLAEIEQRLEQRRVDNANVEWPDSTALLREDRDR
ncbi:Arc family DNA-binding protein [Microcoleus sp. FACHB-672]|uniref:Arc family DNA-binding protein n=1 Tax=Microcoleus sp. FACHB-672 TaxID=2692825 RepID=UPI0016893051|nr:Arc family DNA-binding protein [Microcoleus sp. FACHB-672]MBD2042634.1 Arc family DNA-binding protein [Microcoleus sp. FACHB-672]